MQYFHYYMPLFGIVQLQKAQGWDGSSCVKYLCYWPHFIFNFLTLINIWNLENKQLISNLLFIIYFFGTYKELIKSSNEVWFVRYIYCLFDFQFCRFLTIKCKRLKNMAGWYIRIHLELLSWSTHSERRCKFVD